MGGRGGGKIQGAADTVPTQAKGQQGEGGCGSQHAGDLLEGEKEQQDSMSGEKVSSSPIQSRLGVSRGERVGNYSLVPMSHLEEQLALTHSLVNQATLTVTRLSAKGDRKLCLQ